jgi:hypothetical protein
LKVRSPDGRLFADPMNGPMNQSSHEPVSRVSGHPITGSSDLPILRRCLVKLCFLILTILVAVATPLASPQQAQKPLTKEEVMGLVKAGLDNTRLAKAVRERGIDFEPTEDYVQALRKAGAQDVLIEALRTEKPQPLTKEQVLQLVAGGVPNQRAAMLVQQRGIDFLADEQYLDMLRVAGGDATVIAAVREASAAVSGKLVVMTSPNAEVYLDGKLQGRANAEGEFAMNAMRGAYALKVSLAGKRDFKQSVTLAAGQSTRIEAALLDAPGSIRLHTVAGASISLDGANRGSADAVGEFVLTDVRPGKHELRISAKGRRDYRQSISVVPGQESRVEAMPKPTIELRFPVLIEQGWMDQSRRAGYLIVADGRIKYQNDKDTAHEFDAPLSEVTDMKVGRTLGWPLLHLWVRGKEYKFYVGKEPENVKEAIERAKAEAVSSP